MSKEEKKDPFLTNPEEELQRRLKHSKRLSREEFFERLKEIKEKSK